VHCLSNSSCKIGKKKAFTGSDVDRVVAVASSLVPDSANWTGILATCGKHCHWVPVSASDVLGWVVVWEVVSIRHYVVVGTWIGQVAAELSNCNHYTQTFSYFVSSMQCMYELSYVGLLPVCCQRSILLLQISFEFLTK